MSAKIAAKMVTALAAIDAVEKRGRNQAQGYGYVKATDVANEVRKALHEAGVAFTYQVINERWWDAPTKSGTTQFYCSLHVQGTFTDNESGESLSSSSIGWGADSQDKAPYKAMTGALKYLLRTTFLIPDELDPENERVEATVHAEVERQKKGPISDVPPELDFSYNRSSGVLICRIVSAEKKAVAKTNKPYVVLTVNNELDKGKKPLLYYWHATHADELLKAKGKVVKLLIDAKEKGFTVSDVLEIDGKRVLQSADLEGDTSTTTLTMIGSNRGGNSEEISTLENQCRLLASNIGLEEEELREIFSTIGGGSWAKTLEALKAEKAKQEAAK